VIWATKGRSPLIGEAEETIIAESLRMTGARMRLIVHAIGMVADHVHVALSIPPSVSVADAVGRLKGGSSFLVGQRLAENGFARQSEYGAISLTDRALPVVIEYVENQKQRHADNELIQRLEGIEAKTT
jgi:putative transposase